jgi:hypothetical protein
VSETPLFSATGHAQISADASLAEGKLAAIQLAEKRARDRILEHVLNRTFPNGVTLEEAIITDPFIRAKIYDTIRTARISDQTIDDEGIVTVTVQLDLGSIEKILAEPSNAPMDPKQSGSNPHFSPTS